MSLGKFAIYGWSFGVQSRGTIDAHPKCGRSRQPCSAFASSISLFDMTLGCIIEALVGTFASTIGLRVPGSQEISRNVRPTNLARPSSIVAAQLREWLRVAKRESEALKAVKKQILQLYPSEIAELRP